MTPTVQWNDALLGLPGKSERVDVAGMPFDLATDKAVARAIIERPAAAPFEYVVTPNVDHVVRCHRAGLRDLYDGAWLSVCDSRILARLAPIVGVKFPDVITGSDLTKRLLCTVVRSGESICIIGCTPRDVATLRLQLPHIAIHHNNPPMGFIHDSVETRRAVDFVVAHPSRFVFLAVGSPQQEKLAMAIKRRGASGLGLCIGASILFVVGQEVRAPKWIQICHMEWLFRLAQDPKRLWRRYLVDDPAVLWLIVRQKLSRTGQSRS